MKTLEESGFEQIAGEGMKKPIENAFSEMLENKNLCTVQNIKDVENILHADIKDLEYRLSRLIVKASIAIVSILLAAPTLFKFLTMHL